MRLYLYGKVYFTKSNGRKPFIEWREKQEKSIKADVDARINKLLERGFDLLHNKMLVILSVRDDLYELRNVSMGWRVSIYYDKSINTFVVLDGFKKPSKKKQQQNIKRALTLMYEYLGNKKG